MSYGKDLKARMPAVGVDADLEQASDIELHSHDKGVEQADVATAIHLVLAVILIRVLHQVIA